MSNLLNLHQVIVLKKYKLRQLRCKFEGIDSIKPFSVVIMCVEIVFFLVTYVRYNLMAAEIIPKQRREIFVLGYGNYRAIALWRAETSDS